jgi:hypothetical protein
VVVLDLEAHVQQIALEAGVADGVGPHVHAAAVGAQINWGSNDRYVHSKKPGR